MKTGIPIAVTGAAASAVMLALGFWLTAKGREGRVLPSFRDGSRAMVHEQIEARGISDARVLAAMRAVPRHEFVPEYLQAQAYEDRPLPIGLGQTISQPFIVAYMTQALRLSPGDKVLEIGTGSGYQAAVLAHLGAEVYSVEILCELERSARRTLDRLGYASVRTRCADGYRGWPEAAPFDAVMVTAAPEHVPQPLLDQLKSGGRLVMPVGPYSSQDLILMRRTRTGFQKEVLLPVIFVPMTGEARRDAIPGRRG